jgi:hypothetical protein
MTKLDKLQAELAREQEKQAIAGRTGLWSVNGSGVRVRVRVVAVVAQVYGQAMVVVEPLDGEGQAKVSLAKVELGA